MEYIIGLILAAIGGAVLFSRSRGASKKVVEFEKTEARLEEKQKHIDTDIEELEKRLDSVEKEVGQLTPEEIAKFWNDEDNN